MASKVLITFNSNPPEDRYLIIVDSLTGISMSEQFKDIRTKKGETERQTTVDGFPSLPAIVNYVDSFNVDYNNTGLYTITSNGDVVTISANNPESQFSITANSTIGALTAVVINQDAPEVFSIDDISISEASTTPQDNVKLSITTNVQADGIRQPIIQDAATNPLILDVLRNENLTVTMRLNGDDVSQVITVPKLLTSYFDLSVVRTPGDAYIKVVKGAIVSSSTNLLTYQYSKDDVYWQRSTTFTGLPEGAGTIYIKDSIGGKISISYDVNEFVPNLVDYDALCEISNLNPIRFKDYVEWNDLTPKNPENTLSYEEDIKNPDLHYKQLWQRTDVVLTQIRTNYENVSATLIQKGGNTTPLTVIKRTNNMNITDVRDTSVISVSYNGSNYTGLPFDGGKTYDPLTLEEIADYNIGTAVPEWVNKGDYINLDGAGWHKVIDIVYENNSYTVIVDLLFIDFPFLTGIYKATTVYNIVDWEAYEFSVNFSIDEDDYIIFVEVQDDNFGTKTYLSEWQNVKETQNNTFLIEYYNTVNNELNFATGFSGVVRIPFVEHLKWKPNTEQNIYVSDTNTIPLENKYRSFWDFAAFPLPTKIAEKLTLILSQDRLFINGINYVREGDVETNPIGNKYQIKTSLVKSNYIFDSNSQGTTIETIADGIPLQISPDGGFLLVE